MEDGEWREVVYSTKQSTAVPKMTSDIALLQTISSKCTSRLRPTPVHVQAKAQIDTIHIGGMRGLDRLTEGQWGKWLLSTVPTP
jgi:hypothetical protein